MPNKLQIRISDWTSIHEIGRWKCQPGDEVEFSLRRDSGFQLFATGAAISAAHRIRNLASRVTLRCEFQFPPVDSGTSDFNRWPGVFLTLPGVSILELASRVVDSTGSDLSASAFDAMWRGLFKTGGIIGDGKSQSLVSREFDSPVPEALRSSEADGLPNRQQFERVLAKLGEGLGAGNRLFTSATEAAISGFLFEAFRNSIEHAQPDGQGIWGIHIEKIALQPSDEIARRTQIAEFVRSFVSRRSSRRSVIWICVTVADFGLGIQNTLPSLESESPWMRLLRAFGRGASRKPSSGSPNRGQGLANMLDAAARLNACVCVNSAGLAGVAEPASNPGWTQIEAPQGVHGTSISIFWPIGTDNPDQELLGLEFK